MTAHTIRRQIKAGKLRVDAVPVLEGRGKGKLQYRVYLDELAGSPPAEAPSPTPPATAAPDDLALERAILREFERHQLAVIPLLAELRRTIREQRVTIDALERELQQIRAVAGLPTQPHRRPRPGRGRSTSQQ